MSEKTVLIKLVWFDKEGYQHINKLIYGNDLDIVRCGWQTRSGLHWQRCYRSEDLDEVKGIRKIVRELGSWYPLTYNDVFKPIPPEGKNVVSMMPEAFERYLLGIAQAMLSALPEKRNLTIVTSHNGIKIAVTVPYDYLLVGKEVARQSNLYVIDIVKIPKAMMNEVEWTMTNNIKISNHVVVMEEYQRHMPLQNNRVNAALVEITRTQRVVLHHPEHESIVLVLEPSWYIFLHIPTTTYYD